MSCNCRVCTDHRRWVVAINPKSKKAKEAFDEILSRLEGAETDAAYWKLKYEGKWPGDIPEPEYNLKAAPNLDGLGHATGAAHE